MTTDLHRLYEKYSGYVGELQDDFARHVGPDVAEAYRPRRMSFDDFCRTWAAWGQIAGVQQMWQRRFEAGYGIAAEELTHRLRTALCPGNSPIAAASLGKAA
jgi:hypothetical protein